MLLPYKIMNIFGGGQQTKCFFIFLMNCTEGLKEIFRPDPRPFILLIIDVSCPYQRRDFRRLNGLCFSFISRIMSFNQ